MKFLIELFNYKTEIKWINDSTAQFTIDNYLFQVYMAPFYAQAQLPRDADGGLDTSPQTSHAKAKIAELAFHLKPNTPNSAPVNNITNLLGSNAIKVFSTVIEIAQKIQQRYNYDIILLSAANDEPSRVSLYKKLTQKLAKQMGYQAMQLLPGQATTKFAIFKDPKWKDYIQRKTETINY